MSRALCSFTERVARFATPSAFGRALMLAAMAIPLAFGPALADVPTEPVSYQGIAVDAVGQPLDGSHSMTIRYLDPVGDSILHEAFDAVNISAGHFEIKLGTGRISGSSLDSVAAAFAAHPQLDLEIVLDGEVLEPLVGVLPAGHSLKSRLVAAGVRDDDDDTRHWKHYNTKNGSTAFQSGVLSPTGTQMQRPDAENTVRRRPFTLPVIGPSLSPAVRDLPNALRRPQLEDSREINPPRHESLFDKKGNRFGTIAPKVDDALAGQAASATRTPALNFTFEGIDNVTGVLPPDTEGAVGPNHYIQVVNSVFAIYNKSGTQLTGPANTNTLWAGFGGPCQTDNSGDAIFLYDEQADRYVLTQFAVSGSNQSVCFAISTGPDPTSTYHRYEVVTPRFPDYYKVGVWPDANNNAYYFGTNSGFQGQYDVFAVDRANMLNGATARPMQFFQNFVNLMMPADLDGYNAGGAGNGGPPAGSPGIFYTFRDGGEPYFSNPPADSIDVWEFDVDWNTPANSTFTLVNSLSPAAFNWTVCGFFVSNCIPQPGTSQGIDSASWWPMQRLVYRNFGSHQALVGSWTVDVNPTGNRAAPRWFELRNTGGGWSIYQEGTHSPDAIHRWMPSIAMDGSGNIAIGYSRGNGSNFASIYYATRNAGDTLGTMGTEELMWAATGSQTHSAARWGDYSSMELDPSDDCTFWYTTEYLQTTGSAPWQTRVGTFTIPGCGGPPVPDFSVSCTPSSQNIQQNSNGASTCTVNSTGGFSAAVDLSCAGAPAGISCSFAPSQVTPPADGSTNSALTITVSQSQGTGTFNFDVEATDGSATKTSAMTITVTPEGSNGPQNAVYNGGLGAPECAIAGSSCDTLALVEGRANLGPEPNQPNTLDGCSDGGTGTYLSDESNERIVISTLDSGNFTEGDTVQVEATVYAWSTGSSDTLDLYYAADASNPTWVLIGSQVTPTGGLQTLSAQYVLPTGTQQAVRAQFRYQSTQTPCAAGNYNDRDDLVFAVETEIECVVDNDCDNGLYCDGSETCNAGTCEAGTAPVCDDGLFCNGAESCIETTDSCDAGTPPACDDGQFCNGTESCNEGTDSCDAGTPPVCDDGTFCNGTETCNESTDSCDNGTAPCDPGTETCNEGSDTCEPIGCTSDVQCDDGAFCNGAETCNVGTGVCEAGTPPACDDGAFCNGTETCNEGTDSCDAGTPPVCDDGQFCNGTETCNEATDNCDAGTPVVCDDGEFCNGTETCNEGSDACDAGTDPCSGGQTCNEGTDTCEGGGGGSAIWMSFRSSTAVPGVGTVQDEDIVSFDEVTGLWALQFDGSDVGLGSFEIDGLAILPDGDLLLSFRQSGTVGGVASDDSDVLRFTPTSLGTTTAGSFSLYFDGSDVGLTSNGEDVDGVTLASDGRLIVSTQGGFSGTGATGTDEDVVEFQGSFGTSTSGTLSMRQDLSSLGIASNEDIGSLHIVE